MTFWKGETISGEEVYRATASVDLPKGTLDSLTDEQLVRLEHHVATVSVKVFEASVRSMLKGVKKYLAEPWLGFPALHLLDGTATKEVADWWLPHIFSEGVDAANQTGLLADTLGVDVLP